MITNENSDVEQTPETKILLYEAKGRQGEYSPIEVMFWARRLAHRKKENHPVLLRLENWGMRGSNVQVYWQGRVD